MEQSRTAEVLFQKLGQNWFVFTEVENDVIFSELPEGMDPRTTKIELLEIVEDHLKKVAQRQRRAPDMAA